MSGKSKTKKAQKVREAKDVRDAMSETSTSAQAAEDFLLPDAGVVMIDGASKDDKTEAKSLPAAVTSKPISQKSAAEWAYERLILYIQNFEEQLDPEQEVVMGFTGGDVGTMRIEGMGYFAPDMVTFYGTDDNGIKTQMMQHVSQLNVMLRSFPKPTEQAAANRIGFQLGEGLKKQAKKGAKKAAPKTPSKKA